MSRIGREEWQALSEQLDRLLEMAPADCPMELDRIGVSFPQRAIQLRELLSRRDARDALEDPEGVQAWATDETPALTLAGTVFGPYTLMRPLGEGGMGSVWLARRNDGRFEGLAAIKLLHLSLLAGQGEGRFRREGNLLARLSHPNIARLLDAGIGASAQPFLVLEYVEGEHLDRYCEHRDVNIAGRLRLFLDVLSAVAYAHANLVLHRDLKPANVVVSAQGQVKLLDFGVGKLLEDVESGGPATALTRVGGRAFTPEYASPEQLSGHAVTTASDIYSLGVMLYQMLAGVLPRQVTTPALRESTFAPTRSIPRPSTAVRETDESLSGRSRLLRGDLDWICLKALADEPERRYASASEFADDVQRHLAGQPVRAGPDSWQYRLRKFVGRNRLPTTIAGVALTALIAMLGFALWQAHAARVAASAAELERQRATEARDFLVRVFRASDPRVAQDRPRGQITAKEMLDQMAPRISVEFANDPGARLDLLGLIASIYRALDDPERFHAVRREQVVLARSLYGDRHPIVVDGLIEQAQEQVEANDESGARHVLARVDGMINAAGLNDSTTRAHWWYARSDALWTESGAWPQVVEAAQKAVQLYARFAPRSTEYVMALNQLGNVYSTRMQDEPAAQIYEQAIRTAESLPDPDRAQLQSLYGNLAESQLYLGRFDAAETAYQRVVDLARQTTGEGHFRYWPPMANYARAVHLRGDRERAQVMFGELLTAIPATLTALQDEAAADVRELYAGCLAAEGRPEIAIPVLEELERRFTRASPYEFDLRNVRQMLGDAYDRVGRTAEARHMLEASFNEWSARAAPDYPPVLRIRERWGRFLQEHGDLPAARELLAGVVKQAQDRTIAPVDLARSDLASLELAGGQVETARRDSEQAVHDWERVTGLRDVRDGPRIWLVHAAILRAAGAEQEARRWARQALDASIRYDAPGSASIREARRAVAIN